MLTSYNVISADGFIAAADGSEDFIPDALWEDFLELLPEYDTLIIGRSTYTAIQSFGEALIHPFETTPIQKVVVTRDAAFPLKEGYVMAGSPCEALALGTNILLSSGPSLNTAFLKEGLIDQVLTIEIPVRLVSGIPRFAAGYAPELAPLPERSRQTRGGRFLQAFTVSRK